MRRRAREPSCIGLLLVVLVSCERGIGDSSPEEPAVGTSRPPVASMRFVDITSATGVDFTNVSGSREKNYILELNGDHPAVATLLGIFEQDRGDARVEEYGRLLYDQAVIAEGSPIADPTALARRINRLIEQAGKD